MIDALRDEFPEQLLLFGVGASAAREFGQMPQRVPRERRITVDDAQEERAGLGSGLPVLQQTPEQIIVIVSRERVGVVLHHPAYHCSALRLIITSHDPPQPRLPPPDRLRPPPRTRTSQEQ